MSAPEPTAAPFAPALPSGAAEVWDALAAELCAAAGDPAALNALETSLPGRVEAVAEDGRLRLRTAALVALDLARQGWTLDLNEGLTVAPPDHDSDAFTEKTRVRAQLHG